MSAGAAAPATTIVADGGERQAFTELDRDGYAVLPGMLHRPASLWPHAAQDDPQYDRGPCTIGFPFDEDRAVPLEADAGTAILFDGHLLHRSARNRRPNGFRRALIGHFSASGTPSQWDGDDRFLPLDNGGRRSEHAMNILFLEIDTESKWVVTF